MKGKFFKISIWLPESLIDSIVNNKTFSEFYSDAKIKMRHNKLGSYQYHKFTDMLYQWDDIYDSYKGVRRDIILQLLEKGISEDYFARLKGEIINEIIDNTEVGKRYKELCENAMSDITYPF